MYCYKCGKQVNENTNFCPECGTNLQMPIMSEEANVEPVVKNTLYLEEYGIGVSEYRRAKPTKDSCVRRIPVADSLRDEFSVIASRLPELAINRMSEKALSKPLYEITIKGRDVLPDQLYQKKNGALMSNLKGEGNKFGKQADIHAVENTKEQLTLAVSNVFAVAAVATQMYYMKSIDDKLEDIQEMVKDILGFLESSKQSQVEADLGILKDIATNMEHIKESKDLKQFKMVQLSSVQRAAKGNIIHYNNEIKMAIDKYMANKTNIKKSRSQIGVLRKQYYYYRTCLQEYALSKLIEIQLTDSYEPEYLAATNEEVQGYALMHKNTVTRLLEDIYGYQLDRVSSKALLRAASTFDLLGQAIEKSPLSKTKLDEKLYEMGLASEEVINRRVRRVSDQILDENDLAIMDPFTENLQMLEDIANNNLRLVVGEQEAYLEVAN